MGGSRPWALGRCQLGVDRLGGARQRAACTLDSVSITYLLGASVSSSGKGIIGISRRGSLPLTQASKCAAGSVGLYRLSLNYPEGSGDHGRGYL